MARNKKKWTQHTFRAVVIVAAVLFILNWILVKKAEQYLRKELTEKTSAATGGFYRLTFDDLSVNFFKGELKLVGIRLAPDWVVFRRWEAIDSLPPTYVDARIREMALKGLNLTWGWNFRQLDFYAFDVDEPQIHLFDTYYSRRFRQKPHRGKSKTLYEQIAPYIDVLSVGRLNLEHASVTYTVDNPATSIVYGLRDVSFHGYGFLLDSASASNGKLLYLDHFDFETCDPQVLIENTGFRLTTDSIRLSTRDSLMYVGGVEVVPQEALWVKMKRRPSASLGGSVRQAVARGVGFRRDNGRNFLTARSFDLTDTRLHAFQRVKTVPDRQTLDTDSLLETLALYDVIAPVLDEVAVGRVGIGNARLDYQRQVGDSIETYRVGRFDFTGDDFLIDSLSMQQYELGYFRNIALQVDSIRADMAALNHRMEVERLRLSTADAYFRMERFTLAPRSRRLSGGSWEGSIDTVCVDGLQYDKGIRADLLRVVAPWVTYQGVIGLDKTARPGRPEATLRTEHLFNPLFRYLSIGRIEVEKGSARFRDRREKETYGINDFDLSVSEFRSDSVTERLGAPFFRCGPVEVRFRHFDNAVPGTPYRLAIRNGRLSTEKGVLRLQGVNMEPRKKKALSTAKEYWSVTTPLLDVQGLRWPDKKGGNHFQFDRLRLETPEIGFGTGDNPRVRTKTERVELSRFSYDTASFRLEEAAVIRPSVRFLFSAADTAVRPTRPDTFPRQDRFEASEARESSDVYGMLGRFAHRWQVGRLRVEEGEVEYGWKFANPILSEQARSRLDLRMENITMDTDKRTFGFDTVHFHGDDLQFPLNDGFYALKVGRLDWNDTRLELDSVHLVSPYPKEEFAYYQPHHKDWFDVFAATVSLKGIDFPSFLSEGTFRADELKVGNVLLQNYKNKKIPIRPHIVPMLYTVIQQAPFRFDIADAYVNDFFVIYEELGKKGTRPGKLIFTDMNGQVTGLTNIPSYRDQYIRLEATGKMMGEGDFRAVWRLPVDSLNDRFLLDAYLHRLDFMTLNRIITPLAPAKIKSGQAQNIIFHMDAGSKGGTIELELPYRDLKIALLKKKDGETEEKAFLSGLANWILKHDNPDDPDRPGSRLRKVDMYVERDPYHSTFNYLWQLLKPAMIETVGITRTEQKIAQGVAGFFQKVKNFFRFGKKKKENRQALPTEFFILVEEEEEEVTEIK